jgi:hypothetical protein
MWSEIHYIPGLNIAENYLSVADDRRRDDHTTPLTPEEKAATPNPDSKTLLHLLFWLAHTREGRDFFRTITLDPAGNSDGTITASMRTTLTNKLTEKGVTDERIQSAIVESHVAAVNYERALRDVTSETRPARLEKWGKAYLQHTAFITWCLWEDAKGHEFSMLW